MAPYLKINSAKRELKGISALPKTEEHKKSLKGSMMICSPADVWQLSTTDIEDRIFDYAGDRRV